MADSVPERYPEPRTKKTSERLPNMSETDKWEGFPDVFRNMVDKRINLPIKISNTFFLFSYETVYCWDFSHFGVRFNLTRPC